MPDPSSPDSPDSPDSADSADSVTSPGPAGSPGSPASPGPAASPDSITSLGSDVQIVVVDGELGDHRGELVRLWIDVTDAGGAVGFRPPVTADEVGPAVDALIAESETGHSVVVAAVKDGVVVGTVAVTPGPPPRFAHRVTLRRLQVHPSLQGSGIGARLVGVAHEVARERFEAELALVSVRDGLGLDRFYLAAGYEECGRVPGGLAFEDGDRVDEVHFLHRLG